MMNRRGRHVALAAMIALMGCSQDPRTTATATSSPGTPSPTVEPSSTPTIQDVTELALGDFPPLEPGPYFIDPDADPSTPLRVVYEVPVQGWSSWIGAAKSAEEGWVAVSITTVTNLVRHGCRNHSPADPPVGPSVDDLATALADLAPFRVTSPPKDVTIYGYSGKHLELTSPDMPFEVRGDAARFADREVLFTECTGFDWHDRYLMSWIAPHLLRAGGYAFYGYSAPGQTEEFWILDVEGTRLVIAAERSPGSPRKDLAELRAILDSIRIEP
jgi:hypothetical protein